MNKKNYKAEVSLTINENGNKDKNKYSLTNDKKYFDCLNEEKSNQRGNCYKKEQEYLLDDSDYNTMFMTF